MHEEFIKDYFKFDCEPLANLDAMVVGECYRFTVLTSRLIRMEYAVDNKFQDRPSQTFWFRSLPVPPFTVNNSNGVLSIETDALILTYRVGKPFSGSSLRIQIKASKKIWKYGQKDRGNLEGTARTLDGTSGFSFMEKGLMSKNGFSVVDDSKTLTFNEHFWLEPRKNEMNLDLYFFGYGHDYFGCLRDYYKISGKTPLIPRYILGNWWSRYWEYTEEELKELISTFESHQIPLSVCIIDMDWHLVKIDKKYGRGWTGYTWNRELFPDPKGMLEWLHEKNIKVSMNLHPADGIKPHEECYPRVANFMGANQAAEEPVDFDIADPKFVSAYFDLVHHPLEDEGVDFWWLDWQQGRSSKIKSLDPLWMLNHLHFYDLGRDKTKRSFIFSRWGGKGNHRYPIGFSGDTFITWRSLAYQPYFTATATNVGYGWWSHDIGGHMAGKEDPELYTRWVQFGIFSPIMRLHSTKNQFLKREPWKYDYSTLKTVGDMMRFRHRLIPYIYSMAYRNFTQDIPLMLPMYYQNPEDPRAYKNKRQYWYGSELIVNPVVKKMNKTTRRVLQKTYLPPHEGGYFDFFTHEFYEGDEQIARLYEIDEIPVFAKAGAIVPLDTNPTRNRTDNPEELTIEVFPGNSNEFQLYEDDGESERYREGQYSTLKIRLDWNATTELTIEPSTEKQEYMPKIRKYKVKFNGIEKPADIVIRGDKIVDPNTEYNEQKHILLVDIPSSECNSIKISFSQPRIVKSNKLKDQAYKMLLDADIITVRKSLLFKRLFTKVLFSEKELQKLIRRIKYL